MRHVPFSIAVLACWMAVASAQEGSLEVGNTSAYPGQLVTVPVSTSFEHPIRAVFVVFFYDSSRLDYVDYVVQGSEAAGVDPLAVLFLDFQNGQGDGGFSPERSQSMDFRVPAGNQRHVGYLRFRVRATAPIGAARVEPSEHVPSTGGGTSVTIDPEPGLGEVDYESVTPAALVAGEIMVLEPEGPRPVDDLSCGQVLDEVRMGFVLTEAYDELRVLRDGEPVATIPGTATSWKEPIPGIGPHIYEVVAMGSGVPSIPASCEVLTVTPVAPAAIDLVCDAGGLTWTNVALFDRILVLQDGVQIAELPGSAQSYAIPDPPQALTIYTVLTELEGFRSPEANCTLNGIWIMEVGDVQAPLGTSRIAVPIYVTTPLSVVGFDFYMGIDTSVFSLVRDFDAALEGAEGRASPEYFHMGISGAYTGAPAAGILYDFHAPREPEKYLPPGLRQHVFSFIFDIVGSVKEGDVFPVSFLGGAFSLPSAISQPTDLRLAGAIYIGTGGPPPVAGLEAAVNTPQDNGAGWAGPDGAGAAATRDVDLSWKNGSAYDTIRIQRNGALVAEIAGGSTSYRDSGVAGGVYNYKVSGVSGATAGFPRSTLVSTFSPPGTFLRGDSNRDGTINIVDPIATLAFLFLDGTPLPCNDAADADDDGALSLTDAIVTLHYLFLGTQVLRAPGTRYPWYDPTPDQLSCAGGQ